jgi:hypothetical protein
VLGQVVVLWLAAAGGAAAQELRVATYYAPANVRHRCRHGAGAVKRQPVEFTLRTAAILAGAGLLAGGAAVALAVFIFHIIG